MTAVTRGAAATWGLTDRALLVALLVVYSLGIPGVGVETRASDASALMMTLYSIGMVAPMIAVAASWKWPLAAAWIGVLAGLLPVALAALDLAGLLGEPPPPGMVVVHVLVVVLGLAVAWRSWQLTRR